MAQRKIALQSGQSSITLEGSNITLACSGSTSVKGMVHGFEGAMREGAGLEGLPVGRAEVPIGNALGNEPSLMGNEDELEQYFEFVETRTGKPISGFHYKVEKNGLPLVDKEQLCEGKTQTFSMKEYPDELSLTAWVPLGVKK